MQEITVRVPASTSNLGPGFDCLGIALCIYNDVTVGHGASRQHLHPRIVSDAADRFFKQSSRRAYPFSCSVTENIPRSRGLGSSATIRLGILLALNRLSGNPLDQFTIFRLCAELEGHPDNAAPATFGGFTIVRGRAIISVAPSRLATASPSGGKRDACPTLQRFAVSPQLHFVLFVPDLEIRTSRARNVLPSKISHIAAVENCANACALTAALVSEDYQKLRGAFADHLHQPFRAKLIPFLPCVIAAAEKAGALGVFLSGSGSTIAAVTLNSSKKIAAAMARAAKIPGRTIITHADNRGAYVLPIRSRRSLIRN
jgi:homoserine kinase